MKTLMLILLSVSFLQPIQESNDILGNWKLSEDNTQIEIVKSGDAYNGTVVDSDIKEVIGKVVLKDFKKQGDVWKGKFYAARKNRLLDATLKETGNNTLEMKVSAGPRSKTLTMTRVK